MSLSDRPRRYPRSGSGLVRACLRPAGWLPLLGLAVLAWFLAEVVKPWPEGGVLLTLHGLGPHGITFSDAILLSVIVAISLLWLRHLTSRDQRPSVLDPTASEDA